MHTYYHHVSQNDDNNDSYDYTDIDYDEEEEDEDDDDDDSLCRPFSKNSSICLILMPFSNTINSLINDV